MKCCYCGKALVGHHRYRNYPSLVFCDPRSEWENGEYGIDGACQFKPVRKDDADE